MDLTIGVSHTATYTLCSKTKTLIIGTLILSDGCGYPTENVATVFAQAVSSLFDKAAG